MTAAESTDAQAPPPPPPDAKALAKRRQRRLIVSVIVGAVVLHIIALIVFGIIVVARYLTEPPPATFKVRKEIRIPANQREHKMNMARHEALTPKPVLDQKLVSTRPLDFALPDVPQVPMDQMLPLDPSELISEQVMGMTGPSGFGTSGASGLSGSGGSGAGDVFSFFGIQDKARSVIIMIDVSDSMFGRTGDLDYSSGKLVRKGKDQSFQEIREEALKLIDALSINSRFGILRWSGSARLWQPALVPATAANKEAAKAHIQDDIDCRSARPRAGKPGGTRHDYALEEVFKLEPEVAYMLTDGNATRSMGRGSLETIPDRDLYKLIDKAADDYPSVPRIHTIYYLTGKDKREEERMLRGISRRSKGKFAKVKAKKRK